MKAEMKSIKKDFEFFVKRNGELLKSQKECVCSFKDIFGDNFTNEDIELYMRNEPPRYFETKDGVKFYIKYKFGTDIIHLFQY